MSDSLWPHGLQHARLPWSSLSPGVCSDSCPLSRWCHSTISSSVSPFSFCLQSFPASGSFPMNSLFKSGGQSIGASASAPVLPMNIQGWFPLELTDLISLLSKGLLRVFSDFWPRVPLTASSFWPVPAVGKIVTTFHHLTALVAPKSTMWGPNGDLGMPVGASARGKEDSFGEAEYTAINSLFDQINSCLDHLEKNDHLPCLPPGTAWIQLADTPWVPAAAWRDPQWC